MMTLSHTNATLTRWTREGWRYRVRRRGHLRYIVRVRQRVERSLGPYDDALWQRIQALHAPQLQLSDTVDALSARVEELTTQLANLQTTGIVDTLFALKVERCPYTNTASANGYCLKYWWESRPTTIAQRYPDISFHRVNINGKTAWRFRPHPDFCLICNPVDSILASDHVPQSTLESIAEEQAVWNLLGQVQQLSRPCVHKVGNKCLQRSLPFKVSIMDQPDASTGMMLYHIDVGKHPVFCFICNERNSTPASSQRLTDIFQHPTIRDGTYLRTLRSQHRML
jgi:hypothetical protein